MAANFHVGDESPRRKASEVVTSKSEYRSYPDEDISAEEHDHVLPMIDYGKPQYRRAISMQEQRSSGLDTHHYTRVRRASESEIHDSPKGKLLRRKLSVQEFGSQVMHIIRDELGVARGDLDLDDLADDIRSTLARKLSGDLNDRYAFLRFTIRLKKESEYRVGKVGAESMIFKSVLALNGNCILLCCPSSSEILKVDMRGEILKSYKTDGVVQPAQILPLCSEASKRFYAVLCDYGRRVAFVDENFDEKIGEVRGPWKGIITIALYDDNQIVCIAKEKNEPKVAFYYINFKTREITNKYLASELSVHDTELWDSAVTTSDQKILLCLNQKGVIYKYNSEGERLKIIEMSDNRSKSDKKLKCSRPSALCRDKKDNLYMLDGDNKLYFYDSTQMKWYLVCKNVKACSMDVCRDKMFCVGIHGNITPFTII